MALNMNRRQWLKTGAAGAAGLFLSPWTTTSNKASFLFDTWAKEPQEEARPLLLDNNESPYGMSEKAREAILSSLGLSNRYPHRRYSELKELIASKEGISPEHIILGAGSTEVLTMLLIFCGERGETVAADPTYFDFVFYAKQAGIRLRQVPVNDRFEHDLLAMEQHIGPQTKLIYVCNPSNPTGTIINKESLSVFCERASKKALVAVDEAYHEYVDDESYASMANLVRKGENVVVTRTFSKVYGMAGLRVGYGLAQPEVIKNLEKVQTNFASVAYPSLKAAIAGYQDLGFTKAVREKNRQVKSFLHDQLVKRGYFCIPSQANFVLFRVQGNAKEKAQELGDQNIRVRPFEFKGKSWIRVSLGTLDEMKTFISFIRE